jgi:PAS domain S-box-containing protein
MNDQDKTKEELIKELQELQQEYNSLKEISENVITERKQIEKALKEAEWKFRALFEKGPIGVAYHVMVNDTFGKPKDYFFLDANETYRELTGVDPRGKLVTEAFPGIENDPFDWIGTFGKVARTGEAISFEQYLEPNQRWYNCVGYQYKPDHFVAAFIEITEWKRAEEKLKESEAVKQTMVSNIGDVIVIIDQNEINQYKSPNVTKLFGWKPEELVGKSTFDNVHADDLEATKKFLAALSSKPNATDTIEVRYKCKDGKYVWIEITVVNLLGDHDINGFLGNYHDITERKRAEEKVREKDIQFRKLSANVSDLIFQFTRRLDGTYCVPIASEGIRNIFGCSPEDVLDDFTPIGRVIYPDDAARVISDIEYSAEHLTYFICEFRVQIPGKKIQWIFSRSTPEKLLDGSITWYGFNADITELKKAEEDLINAKERAEESDKLKSAFLANMSHEIRTPMNGILGFSELLKEPDLTGEQQQEFIRIIEESGVRMLDIINAIIDISKIESGLMKTDIKELNIYKHIEYLYTFFKPEVEEKRIQLLFKNTLAADEAIIRTDSEKFSSILIKLVKNAIKYSEEGSVEFGYDKKGEYLEFFVKDTGIGIPKDRQSAIFERFIQADISDKRAYQGAGLGLSISKAYVEMLGGKIWVESEEGIGSTFYFTLPYNVELEEKNIVGNIVQE